MKRAVEVYQKQIVERFTAQKTDYRELLLTFATGFYEELDFLKEVGRLASSFPHPPTHPPILTPVSPTHPRNRPRAKSA